MIDFNPFYGTNLNGIPGHSPEEEKHRLTAFSFVSG